MPENIPYIFSTNYVTNKTLMEIEYHFYLSTESYLRIPTGTLYIYYGFTPPSNNIFSKT